MNKVKEHLKRNKERYLCLTIGVVAGGLGVYLGGKYLRKPTEVDNSNVLQNTALVNVKPNIEQHNNYITQLVRRGHPGNVVRCIETGEEFASQRRAAEVMGLSPKSVADVVHGEKDSVKGYSFELVGDAGELLNAKIS